MYFWLQSHGICTRIHLEAGLLQDLIRQITALPHIPWLVSTGRGPLVREEEGIPSSPDPPSKINTVLRPRITLHYIRVI